MNSREKSTEAGLLKAVVALCPIKPSSGGMSPMTLLPNKLKLISLSTGLPQRVVKEVIQRFTDLAVHDLLAEGRFHHRGLGTFKVVHRRPRNITRVFGKKTPGQKPLQVPARSGVHFKPTAALKEAVQQYQD